ncbi:hypothetical protein MMC07_000005 [Pseudocyphellaria aurata]|nr:hypothetical protein [Pseudocyphellaria aurata]
MRDEDASEFDITGQATLIRCLGVYFQIKFHFAPDERIRSLPAAFQRHEDHLCKLYARYTWESVRSFHLNFHHMAINDGVPREEKARKSAGKLPAPPKVDSKTKKDWPSTKDGTKPGPSKSDPKNKQKESAKAKAGKGTKNAQEPTAATEQTDPTTPKTKRYLARDHYGDGRTVWVNHPTALSANPFDVMEAVVAAASVKHGANSGLAVIQTHSAGAKATALRCQDEATRKLFTDHRITAKLQIGETKHQLQIQAYRGGGNRFFYVSNTETYSEHVLRVVASLEDVYKTRKFRMSQAFSHLPDLPTSLHTIPGWEVKKQHEIQYREVTKITCERFDECSLLSSRELMPSASITHAGLTESIHTYFE